MQERRGFVVGARLVRALTGVRRIPNGAVRITHALVPGTSEEIVVAERDVPTVTRAVTC